MTAAQLKQQLIAGLDRLLASWLVRGSDRVILTAMRRLAETSTVLVDDLLSLMPKESAVDHNLTPSYANAQQFSEATQCLIDYFSGGDHGHDLACAVHAAHINLGFALSFIPHDHPLAVGDCPDCDPPKMVGMLEQARKAVQTNGMAAFDWKPYVLMILKMITQLLEQSQS